MPEPSDRALAPLLSLREQFPEGWDRSLVDIALRALRDHGPEGVRTLQTFVEDALGGKARMDAVNRTLSLRDASDFLAVLQTREADRLDQTREVLRKVLSVAKAVAEELLKIVLGGKL